MVGIIYFKKVKIMKIMKNVHQQHIVITKFDLLDPDPYIEYESGSRRRFEYGSTLIRIRNTVGTYLSLSRS